MFLLCVLLFWVVMGATFMAEELLMQAGVKQGGCTEEVLQGAMQAGCS